MRIVLCVTPEFYSEAPPLGLAYLKASLCREGHFVKCLNFSAENNILNCSSEGLVSTVKEYAEKNTETISDWVEKIAALKPDIVGVTLWTSTRSASCALAAALKMRFQKILVIGGGPDVVGERLDEYLRYFDLIVEQEGEEAVVKLVGEYQTNSSVTETKGVWSLKAGRAHLTAPSERIKDLDTLPIPDFSDFDICSYQEGFSVMFSRGCNANCTFCLAKKYFSNQLSRKGLSVFQEVKIQAQRMGCSKFIFADDSLISAATFKEFELFCDKLLEEKLNLEWRIYGLRVTPLFNEAYVKKMAAAGLKKVTFGVESFSENVRKDMGKVASDAITEQNLRLFLDHGIEIDLLMIYGYPNETDEDFGKTLKKIQKEGHRFHSICFNCFGIHLNYHKRRPGVLHFEGDIWHPYKWYSDAVDLPKRKERFLKLVEVLDARGKVYRIYEPCFKRGFSSWNSQLKETLLKEWKTLENEALRSSSQI